jgi:hypothetical protein
MACGATLDHVAKPLVFLEVDLTASQSLVQHAAGIAIAPRVSATTSAWTGCPCR